MEPENRGWLPGTTACPRGLDGSSASWGRRAITATNSSVQLPRVMRKPSSANTETVAAPWLESQPARWPREPRDEKMATDLLQLWLSGETWQENSPWAI